jgi:hypothetical protein
MATDYLLPLLGTDRILARSVYHILRKHVVAHGYLPDEKLYMDTEVDRWNADIAQIDATKGFHIEMFNESSARHKGMKDNPRIIIFLSNIFDGEIGAPPEGILGPSTIDPTKFRSGYLPGQSAHLVFAIHLMSINSQQSSVLNSILSNVLGERRFIPYYDDPLQLPKIFIRRTSFSDLDNAMENILEKAYYYQISDVFLGAETITNDNVSPIKEIIVEQRVSMVDTPLYDNYIQVPYNKPSTTSFPYSLPFTLLT